MIWKTYINGCWPTNYTSTNEYMMVGSRQKLGKGEDDTQLNWEIIK